MVQIRIRLHMQIWTESISEYDDSHENDCPYRQGACEAQSIQPYVCGKTSR